MEGVQKSSSLRILVLLFLFFTTSDAGPCSDNKSPGCIDAIRKAVTNRSIFWFGDKYFTRCNGRPLFEADCFNPLPTSQGSLMSRIFQNRAFNVNDLTMILNIEYNTHSGMYTACGNNYTVSNSRTIRVEPLSKTQSLTPFELLSHPTISWEINSVSANFLYTLVIIDAGYQKINGLFINIRGNDINNGQTITSYQPPINPTSNENPYVFLLFTQPQEIALSTQWLQLLSLREMNKFEDFLNKFNVNGPYGISWLTVKADPYSADKSHSILGMNTCAQFVNKAFKKIELAYLPKNLPDLNVDIDITYEVGPIQFNSCCHNYSYPANVFKPNPIGNGVVLSQNARSDAKVTFTFEKSTAFPLQSRDFSGEFHTLIMADGDILPGSPFGSPSKPYNHMLAINIREGEFSTGEVLLPFRGPAPSDATYHHYYFLLFKQRGMIQPRLGDFSSSGCPAQFKGRCKFDVKAMMKQFNLQLVGATWQLTKNSDHVRYQHVAFGQNENEVCKNVKGFSPGCKSNGGRDLADIASCFITTIGCILAYSMRWL